MTGPVGRGRRAAAAALATVAALSSGPAWTQEVKSYRGEIKVPESTATLDGRLQDQFRQTAEIGNHYLKKSGGLERQDKVSGGFVFLSGLYGGLVTAFNPAPKNLKAAILALGTGQAWNSNLRPGERGRIYAKGHLAMQCVVDAGSPLLSYSAGNSSQESNYSRLLRLRQEAHTALVAADQALIENPKLAPEEKVMGRAPPKTLSKRVDQLVEMLKDQQDAKARADKRETLKVLVKTLAELDVKLAAEQGAYESSPFLVSKARRDVESAVAKLLADAAPDYKAAADTIQGGLAELPSPEQPATDSESAAEALVKSPREGSLEYAIERASKAIRDIQSSAPNHATQAIKGMGECVPKAS